MSIQTPAEILRAARHAGFVLRADNGRLAITGPVRANVGLWRWADLFREHKTGLLVLLEREAFEDQAAGWGE